MINIMSLLNVNDINKELEDIFVDEETIKHFFDEYCLNDLHPISVWSPLTPPIQTTYYYKPSDNYDIYTTMTLTPCTTKSLILDDNSIYFSDELGFKNIVWCVDNMNERFVIPKWLQYMGRKNDFEILVLNGIK